MVRIHGHESELKSILLLIILFSMAGFTQLSRSHPNLHLHETAAAPGRLRLLSQLLVRLPAQLGHGQRFATRRTKWGQAGCSNGGKARLYNCGRPGIPAATDQELRALPNRELLLGLNPGLLCGQTGRCGWH